MPKTRLLWQVYPKYLLLTAATIALGGWLTAVWFDRIYLTSIAEDLQQEARVLSEEPLASEGQINESAARALCQTLGRMAGKRFAVILPDSRVLCDSQGNPEELDGQAKRAETQAALQGTPKNWIRYNGIRDQRSMFVALPIEHQGRVAAAALAEASLERADAALATIHWRIAAAGLILLVLAAALIQLILMRVAPPLDEIRRAAQKYSAGELSYRAPVGATAELADTAQALNRMAEDVHQRLNAMTRHHNQQMAVLASMVEGVLAVDNEERVISLNRASGDLLDIDPSQVEGRLLQEVVRNTDLRRFVAKVLLAKLPIEADIDVHNPERALHARGSPLHDEHGRAIGAVVVLDDVTEFRRLEKIRRDFVANVSHELKTPVTGIKGFIETVLDGAIHNPVDAERFLRIAVKQTDRLDAIIEDLLSLSKIEQGEEASNIILEPGNIKLVLEAAIGDCQTKAAERNVRVSLSCPDELTANINAALLEQAIANLLDNALKYSEPDGEVRLLSDMVNGQVQIAVADDGCGIDAEHLPRIFERFYRVDRARSRKLGGTGLGLAIVKHIVQAHSGRVAVESTPGRGSVFSIYLPTS